MSSAILSPHSPWFGQTNFEQDHEIYRFSLRGFSKRLFLLRQNVLLSTLLNTSVPLTSQRPTQHLAEYVCSPYVTTSFPAPCWIRLFILRQNVLLSTLLNLCFYPDCKRPNFEPKNLWHNWAPYLITSNFTPKDDLVARQFLYYGNDMWMARYSGVWRRTFSKFDTNSVNLQDVTFQKRENWIRDAGRNWSLTSVIMYKLQKSFTFSCLSASRAA